MINRIELQNISKRYYNNWLFKNVNFTFDKQQSVAITGHNGSGKSTLLKIISGFTVPTKGSITYHGQATADTAFEHISMAAPYLDLLHDFTLLENISYFNKFKPLQAGITHGQLIDFAFLNEATHKPYKYFSSGMKQRIKLALAALADTDVVLLDEPLANLDKKGIQWYAEQIVPLLQNRLCIVSTNNPDAEAFFCKHFLEITTYKTEA
ncbi:MAG: ABC transporter ATP-binding protein [Bacteroidia bacterium]|nr:ABC transporter ATP-binding protein [Bacteroidia bacterium]HQV01307.1 ABC transporter ATP-binding protein [Bacteroidia bacterium]